MKVELFPFQKIALYQLRKKTAEALGSYKRTHTPQVLSFTAPTGAGKTIILASLIESIYYGDEEYPDQPDAIFVWLSDSPELNEQSRNKIDLKADKIRLNQCVTITDDSFDQEMLDDGHIYFLNTQKLGRSSNLTKNGDGRTFSIWETLQNTMDEKYDRLFVTRYCAECGMSDLQLDPYPRNVNVFLQCIDKMIDDYDNADTWTQEQQDVLDKYINCLYSHGYIDFSLMIFETLRQIESNPEVKDYLSRIKYLVVDEYQDVNDLQEKLILCMAKTGTNICVVGDDDQTIYQFRGSNANNMISFAERYSDVHQVRLETNFRCAPGIVDVADRVIGHNDRRIAKKMVSGATELKATIEARRYSDKKEQFDSIAEQIVELHKSGIPYKEIVILVRKGKAIAPAATALDRAGIPFETDSAEHFFTGDYFNRFVVTLQILSDIDKAKLFHMP